MQPLPKSWFLGVAEDCCQPYLALPSCIYSFWHGVIPIDFYTCVYPYYPHIDEHVDAGLHVVGTKLSYRHVHVGNMPSL